MDEYLTHADEDDDKSEWLLAGKADRQPRRLPFLTTDDDFEAIMGELAALQQRYG